MMEKRTAGILKLFTKRNIAESIHGFCDWTFRSALIFIANLLLVLVGVDTSLASTQSHYSLTLDLKNIRWDGYAELDFGNDHAVSGRFCITEKYIFPEDTDKGESVKPEVDTLVVSGENTQQGILQFERGLETLGFPAIIQLKKEDSTGQQGLNNGASIAWDYYNSDDDTSVRLTKIPQEMSNVDYSFKGDDSHNKFGYKQGENWIARNLPLTDLAKLTPDEAYNFANEHPAEQGGSGIIPGGVLAFVSSSNIEQLKQFFQSEFPKDSWNGMQNDVTVANNCGAPYVTLVFSVPPTLEYYYSAKLQQSGLVVTAFPEEQPQDPYLFRISVPDGAFKANYFAPNLSSNERDEILWNMISLSINDFVSKRQPNFKNLFQVIRQKNGDADLGVFRMSIVGPSQSQCKDLRWEQITLQILPTVVLNSGPELVLNIQALDGFQAQGEYDSEHRPIDDRFKENPLPDNELQNWQAVLGSYLNGQGFLVDAGDNFDISENISACGV